MRLSIERGNILYIGDKEYEVINPVDLKEVLLKDMETGETGLFPIHQLRAKPSGASDSKSNNMKPIEHIEDSYWETAKHRYEIIEPLLRSDRTRKDVEERAREFNYSYVTLYDWIKRYETEGTLSSLSPLYEGRGGKGKHRVNNAVEVVMKDVIEDCYLNSQRLKVKDIYSEVKQKCMNAKLTVPHENTVRNRINEISKRVVMKKRYGRGKSDSVYEPVESSFEVKYPLEVIQVDETQLDVILVDEIYRRPIGRPFITIAVDVCSRVVYGFHISFDHPSFFTVGQCLYMGIMPKQDFLKECGVEGEWDVWGLPKTMVIHTDNAKWYRGKDLKRFCDEYGISVSFRPMGRPKYGGHIERLIETLNREVHKLPGTTFSDSKERGDYDSENKAIMTIKELEAWMTNFIVNEYHNRPHEGLGKMTPKKKYELGILGDDTVAGTGLPELIQGEDAAKLKTALLPSIERTVQRDGVTIDNITYYSDILRKYSEMEERGKKKCKYLFKRDPRDISMLYFYAPDMNEYFPVPYRNIGWPPISIWELRRIQKYLKEKNIDAYDENNIFKAHSEMTRIENEAAEKTKAVRRMRSTKQHHRDKMRKSKDTGNKPLRKSVTDSPEPVKKAVDSNTDDIFKDPKPFDDIEFVRKLHDEDKDYR